jgi:hypothetical protein
MSTNERELNDKRINLLGIATVVFVLCVISALAFTVGATIYMASYEINEHQEALYECHQKDMAVIFDKSGYPICISKDILIEKNCSN